MSVASVTGSTTTPILPFAMPSTTTLRSSAHLVFAHYWPPLPISLDNKPAATDYYSVNYLTVKGENGKHAAYGGYLRNRPIEQAPVNSTSWRLLNMETEVKEAISEGLDGFTLDIMQIPGDPDTQVWANTQLMIQAAHAVDTGFKIMLMPDMSGTMADKDMNTLAQYVAQLGNQPSAYHLADGRLVVSPFDAESHTEAWWADWISVMKSSYGISVAFVPLFVGDEQNYKNTFAPISYGMSNWGSRNPEWNNPALTYLTSPVGRAESIESMGQKWMQPVSIQDERPNQGIFDEADNTTNLRDSWQVAITSKANWVQLTTWNDYSENTEFEPSQMSGWTWLDISAYYLAWYKTGVQPTIVRDAVYLSHRTQFVSAKQSTYQSLVMKWRGGTPPRDTTEALSFLTSAATVTITDGGHTYTCDQPAGVSACTEPLAVGTVAASVTRSGKVVTSVTSPYPVVATPIVQDLQYVGVSSLRSGTNPVPVSSAPVSSTTVDVVALADTYANRAAPSTNFGDQATIAVRGNPEAIAFLRFDVPAVPSGQKITAVTLVLHTSNDATSGSNDTFTVQSAANQWVESTLNWNVQPARSGLVVGTIAAGAQPGATVTTGLTPGYFVPDTAQTIAISSLGTDSLWFWSSQFGPGFQDLRPQLIVTYN